jgi:hypothetical protein
VSNVYRHKDGSIRDYPETQTLYIKPGDNYEIKSTNETVNEHGEPMYDSFYTAKEVVEGEQKLLVGKKDAIGDMSKPRLSLIPQKALWALGGALTYGEKHYGAHNWRSGIKISYLLDAALRHINEFNAGENIDQKSQNHHLGNAMANLAMAIELSETRPYLDDRFKNE